jgi:DNA polymerase type B, organellar and viral
MIKNRTYTIENQLLNYELLSSYISLFWSDVFSPLVLKGADKHLMIMVKVSFDTPKFDYAYRSLGHLRCVNHNEQEQFTDYLSERLTYLNESYTSNSLNKIHFSYIVKEGLAKDDRRLLQPLVQDKGSTTHRFNNMNLPVSMIPSDFGTIIAITQHTTFTRYIATNGPRVYQIDVSLDNLTNKVSVLGSAQLSWTDTKLAFDVGFKREIGKSTLYILDGELVVRKYQVPAKPFTQLKVDPNMVSNFVTMDLETITQDGKLTPYLVCAYNGKDYITSYANESLDQKVLFTSFIEQLLTFFGKSNNLMVYAHNLSGFDGIFLMKHLLSFGKVEPLLFNGRLMSIKINNKLAGGKYYGKVIIFKDSYLLLPLSLRKLCKAFNVVTSKGFFPFLMNTINYIGELPQFKYWKGVSDLEYNGLLSDYTNKLWSFKDEAIKYCKLDCKCLYDVLTKFNILIFKEFKVNMTKSLTLPALAMRIFKTHFMPKDSIYQILGSVEQDIRNSYTGGAVDVYIPHNRLGSFFLPVAGLFKKLYYYDVNSLYPAVMAKHLMPIGKPIKFVGDIRKMEPEAFGFFYCKMTSPDNLNHPILQRRIKTSEGIRTIAGLGSWTGWISSLELDNAVKYGYQFEILNGYQFERGDLFSG